MTNINKVFLTGNCGTEPEYVSFESGALLTKFSIAVSRYDNKNKKDITDWFKVKTFSKLGEFIKKGYKIAIDGKLVTNVWENKDGKKIKDYEIIAEKIEILTKKENQENITEEQEKEEEEEVINQDNYEDTDEYYIDENEIPF